MMVSGSEGHSRLKSFVIAVGGGKGGTGKSLLSANLGIALSELKQQVILIDLDLGGANLHTCLGIRSPKTTLGDFLHNKVKKIEQILLPTPIQGLKLINGSNDPLEIANLPYVQKVRLIKQFQTLEADFIILDLGGGTTLNVLDFFLSADYGIVVATPEPTSMENVSLFIKCFMMRHLKRLLKQHPIENLQDRIKDPRNRDSVRTFRDLLRLIRSFDQETASAIETRLDRFHFGLIMNKVREQNESQIGSAYQSLIRRCLGILMEDLGHVPYDDKIPLSVKKLQPLLREHPHAKAAHAIRSIANKILGLDRLSPSLHQGASLYTKQKTKGHSTQTVTNSKKKRV